MSKPSKADVRRAMHLYAPPEESPRKRRKVCGKCSQPIAPEEWQRSTDRPVLVDGLAYHASCIRSALTPKRGKK